MTVMSIVAHSYSFVVGVDTHARQHVYALVAPATGELLETRAFPTTAAGINRAVAWVARRTDASRELLWVVEGAATYGAILTATITSQGQPVVEAPRMSAKLRHGVGKSDELDAHRIATAALPLAQDKLRLPRLNEGIRQGVQVLVTARGSMTRERTRGINALTALLRANDLGLDARKPLSITQINEVSRWRARQEELSTSIARAEAVRLAQHILGLSEELKTNEQQLGELVQASEAAPLLEQVGFKTISAAKVLVAWSHHGRIRSEAAFASLAGVNPVPASSGNTVRHRLNRGGDRNLNSALHIIAMTRMIHDPETREYVEKRRAQNLTDREIRRCIKRYLARRIYRTLNTQHPLAA